MTMLEAYLTLKPEFEIIAMEREDSAMSPSCTANVLPGPGAMVNFTGC